VRVTRRVLLAAAAAAPVAATASERMITGVNLAGLEFNGGRLPGRLDHDFVAPTIEELDYYRQRGARAVRLPFLWERLQPELGQGFDGSYWRLIADLVAAAEARGMRVVLDPHQYGRRRVDGEPRIIGESEHVTAEHFAAFWSTLAQRCSDWPGTIFGLQNEPHDQDVATLVRVHNETIAAIRATGAQNLVLAPGGAWSGAHSWLSSRNAQAMLGVRDPANRIAFDVHQFLDADSSGTHAVCAAGAGRRLEGFTRWAREYGKRGFLGEFGGSSDARCLQELETMLEHMASNRDVWIGWTCWAGGPWWPDDYPLTLEPASLRAPEDRPQLEVLRRYFE
jgi:endoglucanase